MAKSTDDENPIPPPADDAAFFVKLRDGLTEERQENGRIALVRSGVTVLDAPDHPLVEDLMNGWMTEAWIDRLAESADNPPVVYFLCETLFSRGLLQVQCRAGGRALFSLQPAPPWQVWKEPLQASFPGLSPSACLRRYGDALLLEMPLFRKKCLIHDESCVIWLMEMIREGFSPPSEEDTARMAFYRALQLMNALEELKTDSPIWEFHDLLFFHASSIGFHDDPIGATWRLREKLPPEPLFKPCRGRELPLPKPDEHFKELLDIPLAEVLAARRSGRIPGRRPISLEKLSALLYTSARCQDILDDASRACMGSRRPSPSGGALHSLEIYPLIHQCIGLATGAWRYDPETHGLESIPVDGALLDVYLKSNPHDQIHGAGLPNVRLVITSRFLRNSWKYEKIAYRLILQDLGCLYQTLSLTAAALGLASCILGVVDSKRLGKVMKLEPLVEPVIGEMTLSSQPG